MSRFAEIDAAIDQAMAPERHRLRGRLRALRQAAQKDDSTARQLDQLARHVQRSVERRRARQAALPCITYDQQLPILERRGEIAAAIAAHQVVIVCGETGSGKSTQLPKICLEMGRGIDGMIGHTQPRRLAARAIATRLAQELQSPLGGHVGYKIRFTDTTNPATYVKLMTDGILLAETASDRFLNQYDTIILDEAHERSLNVDFLLGFIKRLLTRRPELRCIITSATIDPRRFAEHFATATTEVPIIEVSGRCYPVEVRYRAAEVEEDQREPDLPVQVIAAVDELLREVPGDILVFLPTERDIREVAKTLNGWKRHRQPNLEVLPLYARLPAKEQNRVFNAHRSRRIVLATNVAESSLTVPGIRAVVDAGTARISRYSPRSKVQRLPIEAVSQASADQRKGRCGRLGPGTCIRLYSQDDYLARDRFTTPEIRRTNLAAVILRTMALRLGSIDQFPFIDPPRPEAIRDGYKTLFELRAIDRDQQLTELGRQLGRLPVDPRIGRMILAAREENCLDDVLIIAAALEVQDPRDRPADKQQAADEQHARFADESSDFLAFLKLWDFYHHLKATLSRNQLRRACRQNFLSYNRLREWADIYRQLRRIVQDSGQPSSARSDDTDAIHRALLTGLLSGVAFRSDTYQYTGAGNSRFHLWPGSGLFEKRPKWIVAAEQVETTRRYCRTAARIQPEWIEPLADHLVNRSYSEPHWDHRQMGPMTWEKVSLFGLPIVPRRRVPLGPVDPRTARQLFIQHALVEGQLGDRFAFLKHNCQVLREIEQQAARQRRGNWVVGEYAVYQFYDQALPEDVYDAHRLRRWLKKTERRDQSVLRMRREDLLEDANADYVAAHYPDTLPVRRTHFPLDYRFAPGDDHDGVIVTIPRQAINQLAAGQLDWLVPGRMEEKVTALIRALPKSIRRALVPAPDTARKAVEQLEFGKGPFLPALARVLERISGEPVPIEAFQLDRLPAHLIMKIRVVDEQGKTLAVDQDVDLLRRQFQSEQDESAGQIEDADWNRDPARSWEFGDLPDEVLLKRGGITVPAFPALIDLHDGVALRLVDTPDRAARESRAGARRLYYLNQRRDLRTQVAWLPKMDEIKLLVVTMPGAASLEDQLAELLADRAFLGSESVPGSEQEYRRRLDQSVERITRAVQEVSKLLYPLAQSYHAARLALEELPSDRWQEAASDARQQLKLLVGEQFLVNTPWSWLEHFPRYFRAISYRLDKLRHGGQMRDVQGQKELHPWLEKYQQRAESHRQRGVVDPELALFRWMLEELRVSLFAQTLGTSSPVSSKRLEKQWAKVAS